MPTRTLLGSVVLLSLAVAGTAQEVPVPLFSWRASRGAVAVHGIQFSPDSRQIVTTSMGKPGDLWDANTGKHLLALKGEGYAAGGIAFSPDGKLLAAGAMGPTAKVWETATGQEVFALKGHSLWAYAVAFSPDGTKLATGDRVVLADTEEEGAGGIKIWDVRNGKQIASWRGHSNLILDLAYSPDGRHLTSGSGDGTVIVWDVASGKEVKAYRVHPKEGIRLVLSTGGKRVAMAGWQVDVRVWDLEAGKQSWARQIAGGWGGVCLAFSPDGKYLATADSVNHLATQRWGEVSVWDSDTGERVVCLQGDKEDNGACGVAFSPDGKRLASVYTKGTVKIWDVPKVLERKPQK